MQGVSNGHEVSKSPLIGEEPRGMTPLVRSEVRVNVTIRDLG